jgi:hypothetical protein
MWVLVEELEQALRDNHAPLGSATAHGPGGQHWETTKLGGIGKLGV